MQMPMTTHTRAWNMAPARKAAHRATSAKMSAPWAVLGMLAAFAGGTLLGMFGTKKTIANESGSEGWRMMKHHHHGFGDSACRQKHGEHQMAAPGARGDQGERNEGE